MGIARNKSTNITLGSYVVYWDVEAIHILIKYVGVPMRERASLDVLSRDSHIEPILNQRRKSESLGSSPVNILATGNTLESLLKYFLHKSVEIRFLRQSRNSLSDILNPINSDTSVIWILGVLEIGPLIRQPVLRLVLQLLTFDVLRLHLVSNSLLHGCQLGGINHTSLKKLLLVDASNWRHLGNLLVH